MRYAALIVAALAAVGCATCEPQIIREPYEVQVPVPVPPALLVLPAPPLIEHCTPDDSALVCLQKIGRNVKRLEAYAAALRVEIESHNAAAGGDDGSRDTDRAGHGVLDGASNRGGQ